MGWPARVDRLDLSVGSRLQLASVLSSAENTEYSSQIGGHPGNPGLHM